MFPLNKITFVVLLNVLRFCETSTDSENKEGVRDSKKALMNSLGLVRLPRSVPRESDFLLRRYSAPKFMMGLFEEVNRDAMPFDNEIHVNMSGPQFEMERKYLDESKVDTVISFFKYDHDKSWDHIHQDFKLKFKTKFSSKEDIVKGGELKVFKRLPRNSSMTHENCTLSVYLIPPAGKTLKLLDTRVIHAWTSGWQTFNVTSAIKIWAHFPLANHGLKIVVHHAHEELSPRSFGMVGAHGSLEKRPYLVGFVATSRVLPSFTPEFVPSRERRASKKGRKKARNTQKECKLKTFNVNFKEIGLSNTIIAPKGYNMFFCDGVCSHPMAAKLKASNHAMIQSLLNFAMESVPSPCCVPGELKPINLLFFDNNGNILLKKHPKMIASSCICS